MPQPSWEASNNTWAYGYLKFLDFQKDGFDVHVTFQKDNQVHASIYERDKQDQKVSPPGNVWMTVQTYGLTITDKDMGLIKTAVRSKDLPAVTGYSTYKDFFIDTSNAKAVELGIIAKKPATTTTATFDLKSDKDFPPLG